MYYYLFDSQLADRKYEPLLNRIEFRLIELGLNGRMDRLSVLKNMRDLIETAIKRGAETIVIVGNDAAVAKAVSIVAQYDVTLGIIPVGQPSRIAQALGLPEEEAACDALSKRIVRTIDLGRVNDQYFLFSLDVPAQVVTVECDGLYRVSLTGLPRPFSICNFGPREEVRAACNPQDGVLEAVIDDRPSGWSWFRKGTSLETVLPLKRAKISSGGISIPLTLDGQTVVKTPVTVEVAPKKLRVIVGKGRQF
ncbi:MAG: hypothetical protein HY420_00740 [Candidatus Kerfeldbacteria bacterium]|nr:hypothetical protein [Candidatus Kerfeldbacteria bacterium]